VISRRAFLRSVAVSVIAAPLAVEAQQPGKVYRIGFLGNGDPTQSAPSLDAFRQGLRELGWVEGQNVAIEYRWADGHLERLPALASDLVRAPVDVILVAGGLAVRAALQATRTVPIVVAIMGDPVAIGFAASLARPGGVFEIHEVPDLEGAFRTAKAERADAMHVLPSPAFSRQRARLAELAVKHRLPGIYEDKLYVDAGGLMSYGPSFPDMFRRAASYVDRILKGARPGDLPIEQPTTFEFAINLKAAKALGLTIPPSVLARADQVIE
jgi:putative tryptophan/tyrosine transport system substrate-binding protein